VEPNGFGLFEMGGALRLLPGRGSGASHPAVDHYRDRRVVSLNEEQRTCETLGNGGEVAWSDIAARSSHPRHFTAVRADQMGITAADAVEIGPR
jgi:hypothetical protein